MVIVSFPSKNAKNGRSVFHSHSMLNYQRVLADYIWNEEQMPSPLLLPNREPQKLPDLLDLSRRRWFQWQKLNNCHVKNKKTAWLFSCG